ncbi:hypothetical protein TELCIR_14983 [Teladorsagia circumcincta]|uniref:HEAT repeat protein n=1 Tax=Teladorsagia circumcincta TaxID=45464 RepID=A0A2G9TZG2_TELCI|nr:hypothetical protein TELCIR_14983 [Teladorsagia circumcincta]
MAGIGPAFAENTSAKKLVFLMSFDAEVDPPDCKPNHFLVLVWKLDWIRTVAIGKGQLIMSSTHFHTITYTRTKGDLTNKGYVNLCTELLGGNQAKDCPLLKLWILIGLVGDWADCDPARWKAVRLDAHAKVLKVLDDNVPEVRAAAVYALGCLLKDRPGTNEHAAMVKFRLQVLKP